MTARRLSAALGGGPCLLSSVGDRNISVIVSRHTLFYWIKTKKAPVLYYSKKYKQRNVVRGARGVGRETRAATLQLHAVVLRHAPAWAVVDRYGHNKKSDRRRRRARPPLWCVVWPCGCLCPSGTSNTGITKYRVIPRVLLGNTRP